MHLTAFNIEGFDYLEEIGAVTLLELAEIAGTQRSYQLQIERADSAEAPWLGGYAVRAEFMMRFETGAQRATGRWRRTRYDGEQATFVSVGEIEFNDVEE